MQESGGVDTGLVNLAVLIEDYGDEPRFCLKQIPTKPPPNAASLNEPCGLDSAQDADDIEVDVDQYDMTAVSEPFAAHLFTIDLSARHTQEYEPHIVPLVKVAMVQIYEWVHQMMGVRTPPRNWPTSPDHLKLSHFESNSEYNDRAWFHGEYYKTHSTIYQSEDEPSYRRKRVYTETDFYHPFVLAWSDVPFEDTDSTLVSRAPTTPAHSQVGESDSEEGEDETEEAGSGTFRTTHSDDEPAPVLAPIIDVCMC